MKPGESCGNCNAFELNAEINATIVIGAGKPKQGWCRGSTPQVAMVELRRGQGPAIMGVWPTVNSGLWCRAWQEIGNERAS